jgi:hypothetical protein
MKTLLIALGGAAGLLLTSPALAAPIGYGGVNYVRAQTDPGSVDADGWAVDGSVALNTGSSLGLAANAAVVDTDASDANVSVGGHVFTGLGGGKLGGFAKYNNNDDNDTWAFGAEGQYNFVGFTLGVAGTWANVDDSLAYDDAWGADVQAKVYATDNIRLSGNVGYGKYNGRAALPDDHEWTIGVGGEWKLATIPISVVGDYAHVDFDRANVSSDAFRVGLRYAFGGTLKQRNDAGADLHEISTRGNNCGL